MMLRNFYNVHIYVDKYETMLREYKHEFNDKFNNISSIINSDFIIQKAVYVENLGIVIQTANTFLLCYCQHNQIINSDHPYIYIKVYNWATNNNKSTLNLHYFQSDNKRVCFIVDEPYKSNCILL
jgi:hypothetical protein